MHALYQVNEELFGEMHSDYLKQTGSEGQQFVRSFSIIKHFLRKIFVPISAKYMQLQVIVWFQWTDG